MFTSFSALWSSRMYRMKVYSGAFGNRFRNVEFYVPILGRSLPLKRRCIHGKWIQINLKISHTDEAYLFHTQHRVSVSLVISLIFHKRFDRKKRSVTGIARLGTWKLFATVRLQVRCTQICEILLKSLHQFKSDGAQGNVSDEQTTDECKDGQSGDFMLSKICLWCRVWQRGYGGSTSQIKIT